MTERPDKLMDAARAGEPPSPPEEISARRKWILSACLAALTIAAFWKVPGLPFISYDDPAYVTENFQVRRGLTLDSAGWALRAIVSGNWSPLTLLSHMLDVTLFGLQPAGHHASNLLLHAFNAIGIFLLFSRLTRAVWRSAFLAAFFAVHPLRVESVAWVAERKDVLSALFWLSTIHFYCSWARMRTPRGYLLLIVSFALGLAAKPMLVTLPFALLLLDVWPLGRIDLRHATIRELWPLIREKAPLFVMSLAGSVITIYAQRAGGAMQAMEHTPLATRASNAAIAAVTYIGKTLWPAGLSVFYPHPDAPPSPVVVAACVLLLAGATTVALRVLRTRPFLAVGWFWFLGTLVPVIGIVQVGLQAMADRYTYIPGIGLGLIAAWIIPDRFPRSAVRLRGIAVLAGIWLVALAFSTSRQLEHWRGDYPLFQHALALNDRNWLAELAIGNHYEKSGAINEAIARYRRALELRPQSEQGHNNLGNALLNLGKPSEGIAHLREAVRIYPGYVQALNNLGGALCELGQTAEGLSYLREAVQRAPEYVPARFNFGLALASMGRRQEASREFEEVLRLVPDDREARLQLELLRSRDGTRIGR